MHRRSNVTRRQVIGALVGGAAAGLVLPAKAATLMLTPVQTRGPFYPVDIPLDHDSDLVQVAGRPNAAKGEVLHLFGRVLDTGGRAIPDAKVEIWQCDSSGRYHHPSDFRGPADPDFQGYGTAIARHDGAWRFRTIKPVPYPGRTPHIHFIVSVPGAPRLTTQMYIKGEPRNRDDFLFNSLRGQRAKDSVSVALSPAPKIAPGVLAGQFDIILNGNSATSAG